MSPLQKTDSIAVTSKAFSANKNLREALELNFTNVRYNETGRSLNADELPDFLMDCVGAIVSLEKIDNLILNQLPKLKVLSKYGVGLDNLKLESLESRNILLGWKGGVNKRSVAELTLTMMLLGIRRSFEANRTLIEGSWQPLVGRQLTGKTVGIIGCGHIGKEVIKMLDPFECKILAYDLVKSDDFYWANNVEACALDDLLRRSDVISMHVPLTKRTHHLINEKNIGLIKQGAILINTARGGVVQESALVSRLDTSSLYCGFDVFEEEPANTALIQYPTFFATPHIGGSAHEAQMAMGEAAIRGLLEPMAIMDFRARNLLPVLD
jgi:phosphoglycerate dehydrogenase-like enzyme